MSVLTAWSVSPGDAEKLQKEIAAIIDEHGTAAGIAEMQRRLDGICLTEMRVPLNRNTKNRREVELRMAADQTVTAMWCCFALAIHQTLGFGRDRLNRLHKETVENYRQFNEWNGSGSRDEQQYAFERLRHCAEQALRSEVVIVQENDDYDSRARLWERQLEDSIKASATMPPAGSAESAARLFWRWVSVIFEILTALLKMALTFAVLCIVAGAVAGAAVLAGGIVALAVALLHRLADEIDKRRGRR